MYKIIFYDSKGLKKDISVLKKNINDFRNIQSVLNEFKKDPFLKKWNTKKLQPKEDNIFRLRFRNIRVTFDIDTGNKIVIVYRI